MLPDITTWLDWDELSDAGPDEYHDAVTITLQELLADPDIAEEIQRRWDAFDAYDEAQRARLWTKFRARYDWREVGILPLRRWADRLFSRLNECMPKYKPLYAAIGSGMSVMTDGDEWHKARDVYSTFPQTALGGANQDYASSGTDREYETVRDKGLLDVADRLRDYSDVDAMILDELEPCFMCVMSTTIPYR